METGKTAVAIHAPLSCRIIEANASAVDNIHLIITDPYGAGWLFNIEPTALATERAMLMDVAAYREWLQPRLAEKLVTPIVAINERGYRQTGDRPVVGWPGAAGVGGRSVCVCVGGACT